MFRDQNIFDLYLIMCITDMSLKQIIHEKFRRCFELRKTPWNKNAECRQHYFKESPRFQLAQSAGL